MLHRVFLVLLVGLAALPLQAAEPTPAAAPDSSAEALSKAGLAPAKKALYQELDREIDKMKAGALADEPCPAPAEAATQAPTTAYPFLEHHGYFRARINGYHRLHLGTQAVDEGTYSSGFEPPITENRVNNESGGEFTPDEVGAGHNEDWLSDANLRLRYSPMLHITKDLGIFTQLDILDNLVFGSTPDFGGYSASALSPIVAFSDSQTSPTAGVNSWGDSVRVKQAYGEWIFPLGVLRIGRMADDWGLGMVANGGQDVDADYGDFVDRVGVLVPLPWFKVFASVDWVWEGAISGGRAYLGQPHDYDDADDVTQFTLQIFDRPMGDEEQRQRDFRLFGERKPVLDWGLYTQTRLQRFDLSSTSYQGWLDGTTGYNALQLVPRDAWMVTPDLWLRLLWAWAPDMLLRVELEAAVTAGRIDNVLMTKAAKASTDLMQVGAVLQTELTIKQLAFGIESGFATGDTTGSMGYWGPSQLAWKDDAGNTVINDRLTAFKFDRDYRPDQILYRYVVGGVTNSWFMKPWASYDFLPGDEGVLGVKYAVEYARAIEPKGTPGNSPNLGVELDLSLYFGQEGRFLTAFDWGTLVPLAGLNNAAADLTAKWAMDLRMRFIWMF
jgi:uncharacterized protein (TIGR04551 family)